jgi:multidrug resistance efflux pump
MSKFARFISTTIALLVGAAGVLVVLYAWHLPPFTSTIEITDNAYVRGQVTILSPQLSGYVAEVPVTDFERVKKGQLLVRIDDRIYQQKVKQAEATRNGQQAQIDALKQKQLSAEAKINATKAQIESARTALETAQSNFDRNQSLSKNGAIAQSMLEQSSSTLEQARAALIQAEANQEVAEQDLASVAVSREGYEAAVASAKAALELARIDLANTRIVAPSDGRLGEVGARLGAYVTAGTQLMALVPQRIWVTANFKETQLSGVKLNQKATFTVDALGHETFTGRVESLSPATGSEFSVLKPDNATGNFTKVAQRMPVRIAIDQGQTDLERLSPGMSVVVSIDTAAMDQTVAPAQ